MGNQNDEKFTWVIKDFSSLNSEKIYSEDFVVSGCKWRLLAFPKGKNKTGYLSLYLDVSKSISLPCGWRRHANFTFIIVNQILDKNSQSKETKHWFSEKESDWGFASIITLSDINSIGSGFLLNGELKIVVNIEVLEVIGQLDILEETSTVDVNGFKLLPSQVNSARRLFETHPEVASKLSIKNPIMKAAYMNLVLSVIETLRQSPQKITKDDLVDAYATLGFLTNAGFRLDWLEKKLDDVSDKKEKVEACVTRMEKVEEEFNDLKDKCSEVEAMLEKEKAELSAISVPLSDDDIFC